MSYRESMLKERQKSILDAVVQEHIRTARPVASDDILKRFEMPVSPATVRNEMMELDEMGYLEQPHISAGRIPTDKGYRFFVDDLASELPLGKRAKERITGLFGTRAEDEFVREFSRVFSELAGGFAAAGILERDVFYGNGFSRLLEEPEFQDMEQVRMLGRLVDDLDEDVGALLGNWHGEAQRVFIGEENPLKDARFSAMVVSRWQHPRGFKGFVAVVGPRRMDYAKNISLAQFIHDYGE